MRSRRSALLLVVLLASTLTALGDILFEGDPAIEYMNRPTSDPVSALNESISQGNLQLKLDGSQGYLRSVLDALKIPVESQMAVFSRTSVQGFRIAPANPRTLFFNDSTVVGWVPGGFIEVATEDAHQGVVFYSLEQKASDQPQFTRRVDCLGCHDTEQTLGVPGMLAGSVPTDNEGAPLFNLGSYDTDDRSPLAQRWGGWYVTGSSGSMRHMGNTMVPDPTNPRSAQSDGNLQSLRGKFDASDSLTPYSDIVALMVFEHQMRMTNLLTRIGWEDLLAAARHPKSDVTALLRPRAQEVVDEMLFVDEAQLSDQVTGSSGFAETFAAEGPFDSKGRSLRQLDLRQRLMKYPCSYMIYSEVFDSLPPEAKDLIYRRMWQILSGEIKGGKYTRLSLEDRQAIVEILRGTKQGLPEYFGNSPKS
jgi:hypothetical protein